MVVNRHVTSMHIGLAFTLLLPLAFGVPTPSEYSLERKTLLQITELKELTEKIVQSGEYDKVPIVPRDASEDDVSFYIFNNKNTTEVQVPYSAAAEVTSVSSFDTSLKTIVIIHGWSNTYNSEFPYLISHDLLSALDVNIIIVGWDTIAAQPYILAVNQVSSVAELVAGFIKNISITYSYNLDNFSAIGHSLGAHIAGVAGQELDGGFSSITGLDPAGPLFFEELPDERLSTGDATYIRAIHTNGNLLGVTFNVGDADFWPNGGTAQPGCGVDMDGICSHGRSYLLFDESMNSDDFIAKSCKNYPQYIAGNCDDNQAAIMGTVNVNTTIQGTFYLQTNSDSPYAKGDVTF